MLYAGMYICIYIYIYIYIYNRKLLPRQNTMALNGILPCFYVPLKTYLHLWFGTIARDKRNLLSNASSIIHEVTI